MLFGLLRTLPPLANNDKSAEDVGRVAHKGGQKVVGKGWNGAKLGIHQS